VAAPAEPAQKSPPAPSREIEHKASHARHAAAPTVVAANDSGWRALYKSARYADGLAAAEREGFEEICARGGAEDVINLGELARLAHDYGRAEQAYRAANRRFNSPPRAVIALGRLEFDQHKYPAAAARWFDEYVKRFPHGEFVQEAAGLLLESRLKAGDNAGARDAAESYLKHFPDGPYAKQAHGIVSH
jgi:Tfp pilus assembly protein PilF